jgi:hypothetical protein
MNAKTKYRHLAYTLSKLRGDKYYFETLVKFAKTSPEKYQGPNPKTCATKVRALKTGIEEFEKLVRASWPNSVLGDTSDEAKGHK